MARKTQGVAVVAKLDERSFNRAMATIRKYEGRPFNQRASKAFEAGARLMVAPMRRLAPRDDGGLARSISMKRTTRGLSFGAFVKVGVKPRSPKGAHGHLLTSGHKMRDGNWYVAPSAKQFVDNTIVAHEQRVIRFIEEQSLDIRGSSLTSLAGTLSSF